MNNLLDVDFDINKPKSKKEKLTTSQKCAIEVNEIMKKYNCYFAYGILFDNGMIVPQTLIKEYKNDTK